MDSFFKFYGTDWGLFLFVAIHLWLLGHRIRSAFLVAVLANCCGFAFGILTGSTATLIMNVVFCGLNIRAYFMWRKYDGKV